jgi:hypothetical protein
LGLCYAIGPQSAGCASLIPVQIGFHGCSVPGARKPKPTPRPELLCFENRNRKPKKPTFRLGSVRFGAVFGFRLKCAQAELQRDETTKDALSAMSKKLEIIALEISDKG